MKSVIIYDKNNNIILKVVKTKEGADIIKKQDLNVLIKVRDDNGQWIIFKDK